MSTGPDYDYVVVGAGVSGSVLACRLSEEGSARVLLLEAEDPIQWAKPHPSPLEGLLYLRGHPSEFNAWQRDYGAAGWSSQHILPYFLRSEDNGRGCSTYHRVAGPLPVEDPDPATFATTAWLKAATDYGMRANADFNGRSQLGVGKYQQIQLDGRRWTPAASYLCGDVQRRENLTIRARSHVSRVIMQGSHAVGVEYWHEGNQHTVMAEHDVVLCAGPAGSAHLMMRSGLGPADELADAGIAVTHDLAGVGANLQTRPLRSLTWSVPPQDPAEGTPAVSAQRPMAGGFLTTDAGMEVPDLQLIVDHDPPAGTFTVHVSPLEVSSRGRVSLGPPADADEPVVDSALLSDPADVARLEAGCEAAIDIASRAPLSLSPECIPGPVQSPFRSVGSNAMGSGDHAVVDAELCVRGVAGLRICDASVMPTLPRGDVTTVSIMMAEKAADLIRDIDPPPLVSPHTTPTAQQTQ